MRTPRCLTAKVAATMMLVAGVVTTAAPAQAAPPVVHREGLWVNPLSACDGSDGIYSDPNGPGNVLFKQTSRKITAVVSLKGAAPNTTYSLRLIQGRDDCYTIDASATTDSRGNLKYRLTEAPAPTRTTLFVVVDSEGPDGASYATLFVPVV